MAGYAAEGNLLIEWTARLAVAAYLVRLWADVSRQRADQPQRLPEHQRTNLDNGLRNRRERLVRVIWPLGCGFYLLHVSAAFHFAHGWSHAQAYAHTGLRTAAVTGWYWGGGLWINYAFTLWWPLDVLWSWKRGLQELPSWYVFGMHLTVGFLMFNATVVFGPAWWRRAAVAAVIAAVAIPLIPNRSLRRPVG
jgi:hypothetical protein